MRGIVDLNHLLSRTLAAFQRYGGFREAESFGYKGKQGSIRFSVNRGGRQSDFERFAVDSGDFGFLCSRLHV
jgi:hypothetical protein